MSGSAALTQPLRDEWVRGADAVTAALMEDPRFLTPAQQICGDDVLGIGVDINRYVSSTTWHPATGDENQIACKFIFYLDALGADSGVGIHDEGARPRVVRSLSH